MTAPDKATPVISVILATNRPAGPFLAEALDSLTAQTESRYQLIVVDDGSPDPGAVRDLACRVPGAVVLRRDGVGPAAARNAAAARADGEWLAFLDDDDRWHPDRLAAQVAQLSARPDAVAGYCGMRTIDADGKVLVPADQVAVRDRADIARRRTGILLPNLMVRRSVFVEVGGFDGALRLAEDLDLLLRVCERGPILFTPRPLVDYRAHDANVTRRYRELVRAIDGVLRRHRGRAVDAGDEALVAAFDESLAKNARFAWWSAARSARAALRAGRLTAAVGDGWWALRTAPEGLVDRLDPRRSR